MLCLKTVFFSVCSRKSADLSDPFFVISRKADNCPQLHTNYINQVFPRFKSEVIDDNLNPVWKERTVPVQRLLGKSTLDSRKSVELLVTVMDFEEDGMHKVIGDFTTTIDHLEQNEGNQLPLSNGHGAIHIRKAKVLKGESIVDWVKLGFEMSVLLHVDFTASNAQQGLHEIGRDGWNEYLRAFVPVCETLCFYDKDKMIPMFGFGAIPSKNGQQMNFKDT
eukprot:gene23611-1469_t